ncbi:MAG TPA: GNAT family N-acetyltransferase [Anaerolineales bacterium]|nr:GNAT family N-acetyltransferase [Anaerolineales bacterium]
MTVTYNTKGHVMEIRQADISEVDVLAKLWYDGWQDAHTQILPAELARLRTLHSFGDRLLASLADVRVAGPQGMPVGLCIVKGDELNQLYVSAGARGTGVAARLLADGEARIRANGVKQAWLACAIGNERAARFYEKNGWQRVGNEVIQLETPRGLFALEVWRYEKNVE